MNEAINFAWPVTSVNREDLLCFEQWYESYRDILREKSVIIWGAGIRGTEFSLFFEKKKYKNIFFTDSNEGKWGGNINGFPIISPNDAFPLVWDQKALFLISTENSEEIERNLFEQNCRRNDNYFVVKTDLYEKYVREFERNYDKKILVMGDCEFSTISLKDVDTSNLSEMLRERLGSEKCKVLAMHGMGLRSHYHILKEQIKKNMIPEVLVLMINLDTLTGKQHLLPRSQHEELLQKIYACADVEDEEFKEYLVDVHERSKNIQVEFLTKKINLSDKQQEVKARNYFKMNYMYKLDMETEGIIYLIKIMDLAREKQIKVIPFVPPVNYEYGKKLFGEEFVGKYDSNIDKIREVVRKQGYALLDLSYHLPAEMFAEKNTPDETANENGRKRIAEAIISVIERMKS